MSRDEDGITYYTVRFLNYAGDDLLGTCEVEAGGDASSLAPQPEVISGKQFQGWNISITQVNEDMTVRPVYADLFLITFYDENHTVLKKEYVAAGDSASPPAPRVVRQKIFIGWDGNYVNVQQSGAVYPIYRAISSHPQLNFYDALSGGLKKTYYAVNGCTLSQKLSGECTIDIKLLTRLTEGILSIDDRLEIEGLVFYLTEIKKSVTQGICYSEYTGEHISYLLNDDTYLVNAMDATGTVSELLALILKDTPFFVGTITVDNTKKYTLRINKECTRRAVLMQLASLCLGEISYYGYSIGIVKHAGSESPIDIMKTCTISDISYNYTREATHYSLSLYRKAELSLGDEIILDFPPMGIHESSRIVGMEWNPFNFQEVDITVGSYMPTFDEALYELTETVADIRSTTAKYTIEFGEMIGNGTFYFTRSYQDRPYFQVNTDDGTSPQITLVRASGELSNYIGATLSHVNDSTTSLVVFYCTLAKE